MAAEIRRHYAKADVTLVPGSGGRFEVAVDGHHIFQKSKVHRHAQPGEVVRLLAPYADKA